MGFVHKVVFKNAKATSFSKSGWTDNFFWLGSLFCSGAT